MGLCLWVMMLAGRLVAEDAPVATAARTFTDLRGRSMIATVVSIDVKSVVLKRESDKREFVFPIADLSEADQVFLAENRAALGRATAGPGMTPLATRTVTGTEVAKAKRFAADVFLGERTGTFRWTQRPKFTVKAGAGPLAAYGLKVYEEMCAAAGMTGQPADGPEIILCLGTMTEINALKQKMAPELNRGKTWTWHYEWDAKKRSWTCMIFIVPDTNDEADTRHRILRCIGASFGCRGTGDEFPQSCFHVDSRSDELNPIDIQLFRLLYAHLENGATRAHIMSAVDKNWAVMVAPPDSKPATASKP